jgi:hypothetical protein
MRPLAVLIGIVMGSAVSLAVGLALTWVVFQFLPESAGAWAAEERPLMQAVGLFTLLAAVASASFVGEVRGRPWRRLAQVGLVLVLGAAVWVYWPG